MIDMEIVKDFVRRLKATDFSFAERAGGEYIRALDGLNEYCPITALCMAEKGIHFRTTGWKGAAEAIGLSVEDARVIVYASDNKIASKGEPHYDKVREELETLLYVEVEQ